ncbi:hypothetical protein SH611_11225 [Geminicoccaceae bacterium 1502E]|nr:hypothetical protein [Geminicoccaceae bacterium 1502E]
MGLRILDGLAAGGPALEGLGELRLVEATPQRLVARSAEQLFLVLTGSFDLRSPATLRSSPLDSLTLSRDPAGEQALLRVERAGMLLGALPAGPDGLLLHLLRGAGGAGWPAVVSGAAAS